MQFGNQGIEGYVSEEEKQEKLKKALELHMLENREDHLAPIHQTNVSLSQFDLNSASGSGNPHLKLEKLEEKQEKKLTIEEQRLQQQNEVSGSLSSQNQPMQVRSCPCCINFLQHKFGMSEKEARKFAMGSDDAGVGYAASSGADYASGGSGDYSGGGGSGGNYGGSGGGGYKG